MVSDEVRRKIDSLSPREKEVFELVCEELTYKEISKKLHMSESAVKTHMKAVRIKFGIDHLSRRKTAIEINNTYCSALKEIRDQSDKKKTAEKESKVEAKPEPQDKDKEKVPVKEPGIVKDKEGDKEKEELNEDVFERVEKKDDKKSPFEKPRKPLDKKKDGYQMKKTDQPKKDRFRSLKTIWRVISIAAIIFSGYMIYDRFFGNPPTQPTPSAEEPGVEREEIAIAETEALPADEIQPAAEPTETVIVPTETPALAPTTPPKPAMLFEDDFEKGLSDSWETVLGNPIIVNGMLSTDQDTWLLVGDPSWTNYSVEFNTEQPAAWNKQEANVIGVRADGIDNMYAFSWATYVGAGYVYENGERNQIPNSKLDFEYEHFRIQK